MFDDDDWGPVGFDDDFEDWDDCGSASRLGALIILIYLFVLTGAGLGFILWITNRISHWAD